MTEKIQLKDLNLPGRFEKLETESRGVGCDLAGIIQPVDSACNEIEIVLREVQTSGLGRLQFFHGYSGCGKTTFLHGLKYFFKNIDIISIPKEKPLTDIAQFIRFAGINTGCTSSMIGTIQMKRIRT